MGRDAVTLRQLEPHREETILGRVPIKDPPLGACRKNGWGWSPLDFRWRHQRLICLIHRLGHRHRSTPFKTGEAALAGEEVADDRCNLSSMALESEMTGIEQVDFSVRVVAFES